MSSHLSRSWAGTSAASRRVFLKRAAVATVGLVSLDVSARGGGATNGAVRPSPPSAPWYRRVLRWGQTNITERDPTRYDIPWWREYWKLTRVQGVIINAGGIVAYYPSQFPLHHRAEFLGDRDLFGDLVGAAREERLAVLARMDSNRTHEDFYRGHPDWFAVDADGTPYRAGELYVTCINGLYYREYLPGILREIAQRYHPDGFTDNSWSGLGRSSICFCEQCARKFSDHLGQALPRAANWDDPIFRQWIRWSYACRLEIWDLNNRVTREAGGPDCLWVGMNSGSISGQCQSFRDYKEICARAEIILLDHQARSDTSGFQQNGETGKLIHGLLGWDKLIPESMALYQAGRATFRLSAKPEPEVRLWMLEGFAGGIQPWWHHVGAYQEDRRAFRTVAPINRWHHEHQEFLVNRQPIASVGVVWSQQNTDFYGRDEAEVLVEQPWRGITQALIRARIPYQPVHADHIERHGDKFEALVLPNLAAMNDAQVAAVRRFVELGGGLLATGDSSLADEWGDPRADFALADLFGAHVIERSEGAKRRGLRRFANEARHTYLRLMPGGAGATTVPGRHPILRGFEETDILAFGGTLNPLQLEGDARVLLTFVPAFPVYPPETAWMRQPTTDIPGLIAREQANQGRVVFLSADLDRRFARDNLPDHGHLLANLVRWVAHDNVPLAVEGVGLVDCQLYRQPGRVILHLVNLSNTGTWRAPVHELIPIGPFQVRVKLPSDVHGTSAAFLVVGGSERVRIKDGWASVWIKSVLDHEVVVIS